MATSSKSAVRWLQFSHLATDMYPGFIVPMLPFIAEKISIQMAAAMLIIGLANITSYFCQPLFGFLADKCHKRLFIFWGILIASICLPMMGFANSFLMLAVIIVAGEVGVGMYHPQATSFIPVFSKDDVSAKIDMGWFLSLGTIGYGLGGIVSTRIYDLFGFEAFLCTPLWGILTAFLMFVCVPKISCEKDEHPQNVSAGKCIRDIFTHPTVRLLVGASIIKSVIITSFSMIMPFYWKNIGFSATLIGIIGFAFLASSTAGMLCSPFIEKKIGTRNVYYLSFLTILPAAFLCLPLSVDCIPGLILIFVLIGFLGFLTVPINIVTSQKLLPEYKSLISGIVGGFSWGIVGIMLPLFSFFAEKIGILNALVVISCIPFIFCHWVKNLPKKFSL